MPDAVVIVEAASGRILHSNRRAREMCERLGRAAPDELTDDWLILHPDNGPYRVEEWPLVRSIGLGERVVGEEYFTVLADRSRMIVRCSSSPIYDDDGELVAGVLVMADITDQKELEQQLGYHDRLLEHLQDAVLVTDDRFVLTAWNTGAETMFGWTAEEAVGRPVYEVLPQGHGDEQQGEELQELAQTGRWRGERVWYAKDGTAVHADGLTVAVRGDHDEVVGYLCIMRDAAERQSRARQQAAVAQLGLRALSSDDLQALMDEACVLMARTLNVELAKVTALVQGDQELLIRAGTGWDEGVVGTWTEPVGKDSQDGYTLVCGKPVVTQNLTAEKRFAPEELALEHGARSAVSVVIESRARPFGVLRPSRARPGHSPQTTSTSCRRWRTSWPLQWSGHRRRRCSTTFAMRSGTGSPVPCTTRRSRSCPTRWSKPVSARRRASTKRPPHGWSRRSDA